MIKNYFKIAWRNLLRSKLFTSINIFGLSVGMTCCMLLLLYILSEVSFDKHHEFVNDIYLLRSDRIQSNAEIIKNPRAPFPYAGAVNDEYEEVVQSTRLWQNFFESKTLITPQNAGQKNVSFYETKGYHVDSTFFDVFTYDFVEGDPKTALMDAHSVVLCEEVAHKLFGDNSAINQTIKIGGTSGNDENFKVTGVYKDESKRSHIDARFFLSMNAGWVGAFLRDAQMDFSGNNMFYTYLRLNPKADAAKLEKKFPAFIDKYAAKDIQAGGYKKVMHLLPVADIHLFSEINGIVTPTISKTYLYVLGSIALFTLLIACINFMNLSTARSSRRASEVGVRKVLGANRGGLIWQFLGESMVLTFLALVFSLILVVVFLPGFNHLTDKLLNFSDLIKPEIGLAFVLLALLTGLLAGSYPAFYLSVFNPLDVMKGRFKNSVSAIVLRKGLVVFQFVIAIGLVVGAIVIQQQMKYMKETPLGFKQNGQLVIPFRGETSAKAYTALRNEVLRDNRVAGASGTGYYPGILNPSDATLHKPDQSVDEGKMVKTNWVSPDFMKTMGFELVTGRMLSAEFPGDTSNKIVVNEATLRKFAIPADKAVGQRLNFTNNGEEEQSSLEIVGVVKDFHFENLHKVIEPYAFLLNSGTEFNYLIVQVKEQDMAGILPVIESKWKSLVPDQPFEYSFVNDDFQSNYKSDERTSSIVNVFTVISIIISCLGLLGLTTFTAQQRLKEIGVRKVLGASVVSIVRLLSFDFMKLVVASLIIAAPLSWYLMSQWLKDFAYRIDIRWWMLGIAGIIVFVVALVTISFQSMKAALTDPVKSLKSE